MYTTCTLYLFIFVFVVLFTLYTDRTGLKFESQKWKMTLKKHLNTISTAFWKKPESWNSAVAREVTPMTLWIKSEVRSPYLGKAAAAARAALRCLPGVT